MLGTLDESHIIRTIEYWDIERRRYPSLEHRAVIVAEEVTNRFFNVIGLLNRAIPIIAIQLNAIVIDSTLILDFVKVLDITEPGEEEEQGAEEQVDRKYWESKASSKSLEIMDKIISMIPNASNTLRITFNRSHVAVGTTGTHYCWFHPRRGSHMHLHMKVGEESRNDAIQKLEERGIECGLHHENSIKIVLTSNEVEENIDLLKDLVAMSEKHSQE